MRSLAIFVTSAILAVAALAQAPPKPAPASKPKPEAKNAVTVFIPRPLLPDAFAGWSADGSLKPSSDPAQLDQANSAALREYGFQDGILATYKREGQTLAIHA